MSSQDNEETLEAFRQGLFEEGILHEGDSIGTDDETLLRFLRARKFDLKESKKMIQDCQEWRRTVEGVGIDELYRRIDPFDYPEREAVFDCWPMWFHKTDKQGRALNVHVFGGMDLQKLYTLCTPEKHWQTVLVNAESLTREILPATSRKAGKPIGTVLVVADLKGFGLSQFWQMKSLIRSSFQVSQDYFPETMGKLAIVNAPSSFTFIWSAIKPWVSKETAEKVDILGSDYKDVLLELVDAENLPSILGGTCTCEGKGGCHLSGVGPWMEGREGWGPNAMEQRGDMNGRKGGESEVGTCRSDETAVTGEARIVPTENGETTEVDVGMKELNLGETIEEDNKPAAALLLSSSQRNKKEGANPKEYDSLRAQKGLNENPIENAHVELPTSKSMGQRLTNGALGDQHCAKMETMN